MKKRNLLVSLLLLTIAGAAGALAFYFLRTDIPAPAKQLSEIILQPRSGPMEEENEQDEMEKAIEQEVAKTRDPRTNDVPLERLLAAQEFQVAKLASKEQNAVSGISWVERGPNNISGRTRTILYDANVPSGIKVWSAGVGGGLWYTNDITAATPVWNKVNDFFDNMAITTIAQDPSNPQIMYFGTGEGWFNADAIRGLGIWKSTDGGTTWNQLANTNNTIYYYIQKIICPAANVLLASTRDGGLRRSIDGGTTWTQVLGSGVGIGGTNRAADIEIAANGDIYATLGIFSVGGIYRSTDGGATFSATAHYASASDEFRIEIAPAPNNADIIYALVQDGNGPDNVSGNADDNRIKKVMRTINATSATPTWTTLTTPNWCDQGSASTDFTRTQSWYDLIARVDPANSDIVYIGGVDVLKTINGGTSWTQITSWAPTVACNFPYVHADIHDIVFKPGSSTELLVACDGGLHRSTNSGVNFTDRNTGFNITQYYACAMHPTNSDYFLAGAQDNGTHKFTAAGLNNVTTATGGDGGFTHIDQDNPNIQITSFTGNNYSVSTNGGASFTSIGFSGGSFINPTDYDDAGNILYGNFTGGQYFRWTNPANFGNAAAVPVTEFAGSSITSVTVSPTVLNRVYFGLANGSVVRVDNAHATPTAAIAKAAGGGSVSCVTIDAANEDHALVTYSNYGVTSVFETNNITAGSPSWTSVEGNLPDMPVRWAIFDPRNTDWVLLATELGVWSTDNLNGASTDWDPTNTNFVNTRVDMLQYRTSDRTIAAATHGRGLFTAVVPAATTPNINFEAGVASTTEQTVTTSGCRSYREFTINMLIESAPTGDANVNLSVRAGNTAVRGTDFEFTTNGNFTTPSSTLTFTNGATTPRTISIRVYDDAEVESTEQFILDYTISGTTNAVKGTSFQSYSLAIADNDFAPVAPSTSTNYSIGTYNLNSTNVSPFRSNRQKHRIQSLFTAAELTAAGMSAGNISAMTIRVATKNSTQPYTGLTISLAPTSATTLATGFQAATFTQVWTGNYSTVAGANNFAFGTGAGSSSSFVWNGTSNVLVNICFDNAPAAAEALADLVEATSAPLGTGVRASTYSDFSTGGTAGCSLPAAFISDSRMTATFTLGVVGNPPATVLSTSRTEYLGANSDIYFYNGSEIIARIRNLSSHDYGCTQVIIDRAGTGASPFWNNNPANYLMNKTFRVIPTTNNASGTYEITVYLSQAEVNGWQSATGQSINNIQFVKVGTQISDVTPATPNAGGPKEIVVPVRGTFGTHTTLTYTFNTGFSGFGAGVVGASLPVGLLDFTARLKGNNAILDWSTAFEANAKGFDIERSYDGVNFTKIGYIAAAGNSNSKRSYVFPDPQIAQENNYYRLKQLDQDNKFEYSKIAYVKNPKRNGGAFTVLNNPFVNNIDVQFRTVPQGKAEIRLMDVSGKQLYRNSVQAAGQTRMRIDLSSTNLSAGVYLLEVTVNNERFVERVLKQ